MQTITKLTVSRANNSLSAVSLFRHCIKLTGNTSVVGISRRGVIKELLFCVSNSDPAKSSFVLQRGALSEET